MNKETSKEMIERVGYDEFYRYYEEKKYYIGQLKEEIERLKKRNINLMKSYRNKSNQLADCSIRNEKAIAYILSYKNKGEFFSEGKLLNILQGEDNE